MNPPNYGMYANPAAKKKEHESMLFPEVRYRVSRYYTCHKSLDAS